MNKYQKVISQIAKDDSNKRHWGKTPTFREARISSRIVFGEWAFRKLLDYKNWNKGIQY